MLYLHNLTLFTPHTRLEDQALLVEAGRIQALGSTKALPCPAEAKVMDGRGLFATPGFIDLQLNGAFGLDFTADPSTIWAVAAQLPRYGLTSFLPTIITSPLETVAAAQQILAHPPHGQQGSIPLGLHLEGPFLNPQKKGAHNARYLQRPNLSLIQNWSREQKVCLVTLAPELAGALDLVSALFERGVVVSAGHSMATFEEARLGIKAGMRYGTHLFNAMPPLAHRNPGLVAALLTDPDVTIGLIVDGQHLHPALVKLIWQTVGWSGLTLVTDAMAALGRLPGQYQLGDLTVTVDEQIARLPCGTLAGSILSPDQALRNLLTFTGCQLTEALPTLTSVPAALLGLDQQKGYIAPGYEADLTLLTPEFEVAATMVGGMFMDIRGAGQF